MKTLFVVFAAFAAFTYPSAVSAQQQPNGGLTTVTVHGPDDSSLAISFGPAEINDIDEDHAQLRRGVSCGGGTGCQVGCNNCAVCTANKCTKCADGYGLFSGTCLPTCKVIQCPPLIFTNLDQYTKPCLSPQGTCSDWPPKTKPGQPKPYVLQVPGTKSYCVYTLVAANTTCRDERPGTKCDVKEVCDGKSFSCPSDCFKPPSALCNDADGPCEDAAYCTGDSFTCPDKKFTPGKKCGDKIPGLGCDLDNVCEDKNAQCPNTQLPEGAPCNYGADDQIPYDPTDPTICTKNYKCSGGKTRFCNIPNEGKGPDHECRSPNPYNVCDAPETCEDSISTCPDKDLAVPGEQQVECAPSRGECENPAYCDGSLVCPSTTYKVDEPCGDKPDPGYDCDLQDVCVQDNPTCPPKYKDPGTVCTPVPGGKDSVQVLLHTQDVNSCVKQYVCGSGCALGTCVPVKEENGTPCGTIKGDCDLPDVCSGDYTCPDIVRSPTEKCPTQGVTQPCFAFYCTGGPACSNVDELCPKQLRSLF